MTYTYDELRKILFPKLYEVYDIFVRHFGEDRVDLQQLPPNHTIARCILNTFEGRTVTQEFADIPEDMLERIKYTVMSEFSSSENSSPFILVYWPTVTITNENNKSILIQELYAKVPVTIDGYIPIDSSGFRLNRAHYNYTQFINGYMHSHISDIPTEDFRQFKLPCLGTGPIRDTISSLKNTNDEITWMLFCQELGMYVTVESLRGGPYHRMENLSDTGRLSRWQERYSVTDCNLRYILRHLGNKNFKQFVDYYLHNNHLSFNFINGQFCIALPFFDYMVDISNAFIQYCNAHCDYHTVNNLYNDRLLLVLKAINGKFYREASGTRYTSQDVSRYNGQLVCKFKGKDIRVSIEGPSVNEEDVPDCTILSYEIAMFILGRILRIINYKYKNEEYKQSVEGEYSNTDNSTTTTHKTILYI